MGVMKRVLAELDKIAAEDTNVNVTSVWDRKLHQYKSRLPMDKSYCFVKDLESSNGKMSPYLVLCGSKHDLTITFEEFYKRVKTTYDKYGERAKAAEANEGVDFKALSHALRAVDQMVMLLETGMINYPLKTADNLKAVKSGEYSWKEVEPMILDGLDKVDRLREVSTVINKLDPEFVRNTVLSFYD